MKLEVKQNFAFVKHIKYIKDGKQSYDTYVKWFWDKSLGIGNYLAGFIWKVQRKYYWIRASHFQDSLHHSHHWVIFRGSYKFKYDLKKTAHSIFNQERIRARKTLWSSGPPLSFYRYLVRLNGLPSVWLPLTLFFTFPGSKKDLLLLLLSRFSRVRLCATP